MPDEPRAMRVELEDQFLSLQTFEVHISDSDTVDFLISFLKCYQLPRLTRFLILLHWQPPATCLRSLFQALAGKVHLNSISIYFRPGGDILNRHTSHTITNSTLQPLFALRLKTMYLIGFPHNIDKTAVSNMAKSWPNLIGLGICLSSSFNLTEVPDRLHIQNLEILADGCHSLKQIMVDLLVEVTERVEARTSIKSTRPCTAEPLKLYIGNPMLPSTVEQVKIAGFLTGLFPNVRVLPYAAYQSGQAVEMKPMDDFIEMVEIFKKSRAQERLLLKTDCMYHFYLF